MEQGQIRKIFSRVGLGITLFYLITVVLATLIQLVLLEAAPQILEADWSGWLISYIPMYLVAMPIVLLIWRGIPNFAGGPLETKKISPLGLLATGVACWFMTLALNTAMLYLAALIEAVKGSEVTNALAETAGNSNPWVNFVIVGIVAPVMEEFVFRKKLHDKLVGFGGKTYILVSALLFALFHVNFYQLAYAFLLGVVFATLMYLTGKMIYSTIVHMMVNWMGAAGSGLVLAYGSDLVHTIWFIVLYAIAAIGLVVLIWWLVKKRKSVELAPAEIALPSKGIVFKNFGMIFALVVFGAFIIAGVLMPPMA